MVEDEVCGNATTRVPPALRCLLVHWDGQTLFPDWEKRAPDRSTVPALALVPTASESWSCGRCPMTTNHPPQPRGFHPPPNMDGPGSLSWSTGGDVLPLARRKLGPGPGSSARAAPVRPERLSYALEEPELLMGVWPSEGDGRWRPPAGSGELGLSFKPVPVENRASWKMAGRTETLSLPTQSSPTWALSMTRWPLGGAAAFQVPLQPQDKSKASWRCPATWGKLDVAQAVRLISLGTRRESTGDAVRHTSAKPGS